MKTKEEKIKWNKGENNGEKEEQMTWDKRKKCRVNIKVWCEKKREMIVNKEGSWYGIKERDDGR